MVISTWESRWKAKQQQQHTFAHCAWNNVGWLLPCVAAIVVIAIDIDDDDDDGIVVVDFVHALCVCVLLLSSFSLYTTCMYILMRLCHTQWQRRVTSHQESALGLNGVENRQIFLAFDRTTSTVLVRIRSFAIDAYGITKKRLFPIFPPTMFIYLNLFYC